MQLASVAEEAGLNFTWSAWKSRRHISNGMAKFKVDYIEERVTNLRDNGLLVPASPKELHCGFKQILDSLLDTGSA